MMQTNEGRPLSASVVDTKDEAKIEPSDRNDSGVELPDLVFRERDRAGARQPDSKRKPAATEDEAEERYEIEERAAILEYDNGWPACVARVRARMMVQDRKERERLERGAGERE